MLAGSQYSIAVMPTITILRNPLRILGTNYEIRLDISNYVFSERKVTYFCWFINDKDF